MFKLNLGLSAAALALTSSLTMAEIHSCDYNLPYDISIEDSQVVITDDKSEIVRINKQNQLFLSGDSQSLTEEQQHLVKQMGDGYRNLLPTIANIAAEGVEIGVKAATLTLNALMVDDPALTKEVSQKLDKISERIKSQVNERHLNGKLFSDDPVGPEIEQEIEAVVEQVVEKASGKVILKAISQALSGDEQEIKDLEFRMDMFANQMAEQVEADAQVLEQDVELLCDQMAALDDTETALQKALPNYKAVDLIQKK